MHKGRNRAFGKAEVEGTGGSRCKDPEIKREKGQSK